MYNLYRITYKSNRKSLGFADENKTDSETYLYFSRLIKLIPSEVLALYTMGNSVIPKENNIALMLFSTLCLVFVIVTRIIGTKSQKKDKTQWMTVIVSSISFAIWVYVSGGPFIGMNFYSPWSGTVVMGIWVFIIPFIYKGDIEQ